MRFKIGDLARVKVAYSKHALLHLGEIICIEQVSGTDLWNNPYDYASDCRCDTGHGPRGCAFKDWQLEPIQRSVEPISLTRSEEVSV